MDASTFRKIHPGEKSIISPGCEVLLERQAMNDAVDIIRSEIADVQHIVQEQCWLEGERRGYPVTRHDPVIQRRVADIILNGAGAFLRRKYCGSAH